jgi:hypothetical protein
MLLEAREQERARQFFAGPAFFLELEQYLVRHRMSGHNERPPFNIRASRHFALSNSAVHWNRCKPYAKPND